MKKITTVCAILFFATQLFAQSAWHYLPDPPYSGRIDDVFFINSQQGWCGTGNSRIFKTVDGGIHWEMYDSLVGYVRCIEFFDENLGFAGTLGGKLLRTTDGGDHWTNIAPSISPAPDAICGLSIVDSLYAYAVGQWDTPGFFLKTTDGGLSWTSHDMAAYAKALIDACFISRDTGFVTGQGPTGLAVILYTTNGGQSWEQKFESSSIGHYVWKIQRVTKDFWVASIQTFNGGRYAKSFDGGQTWAEYTAPIQDMQGIGFATPLHGWVGGYVDGFYETKDGGENWEYQNFGGNFNRFFFLDSTLAYASGNSIYKYSDTISSSVVQPLPQGSPSDGFTISLSPNPVKSNLSVQFYLPIEDNLRMGIYATDGTMLREVYHKRLLPPGEYQFEADCSTLPPGSYFLGVQRNFGLYAKPFSRL